jgi:hypothetical protein
MFAGLASLDQRAVKAVGMSRLSMILKVRSQSESVVALVGLAR